MAVTTVLAIPDWFGSYDQAVFRDDVAILLADAQLNAVSITYKQFNVTGGGTATYEPTTGAVTSAYTDKTVTCIMGPVTDKDVALANKGVSMIDTKFLINRADLSADPTANDLIVYSSNTYNIRYSTICLVSNLILILASIHGGK